MELPFENKKYGAIILQFQIIGSSKFTVINTTFFLNIHNFNNVNARKLCSTNSFSLSCSVRNCKFAHLIGLQVMVLAPECDSTVVSFHIHDAMRLQDWLSH